MYEQHFGLRKRPFHSRATGPNVFVGPQIAASMAGLKKAMLSNDAVATVSGPVGTGKTTLVLKALDAVAKQYQIIVIGRMRLQSNDVLELLLDELGIDQKPRGVIQKFNAFRRRLEELDESGTRLFVVVEDSARLGVDTLAEIEALTAADAGVSEGAGVVLMGDESLRELLADSQLDRLQQRIRQRLQTEALREAELRGYLRHCFRLAGGDFEQIFESNASALLHHVTGGIPRVANSVVDAALKAAAERESNSVPSELLARIAENEFGLSAAAFDLAPPPEAMADQVEAVVTQPEKIDPEPVIVFADVPEPEDLPELIQDTLPDLQVLAPQSADDVAPENAAIPETDLEQAADHATELPEPDPVAAPDTINPESEADAPSPAAQPDPLPAWDRDPTMAELKPDLDALEEAMAFTLGGEPATRPDEAKDDAEAELPPDNSIPEITLDHAISQRIESKLMNKPGEISPSEPGSGTAPTAENEPPIVTKAAVPADKVSAKPDREMEKIAAELARAKSLEDVDDRMAETLFGEELSLVASQFINATAEVESANEEIDAVVQTDQVIAEPAMAEQQIAAATGTSADVEVTLQKNHNDDEGGGMDLSASQRLKTVRALNADLHPSLREAETPAANDPPAQSNNAPDSIEEQINISMTQTMKALKIPQSDDDDDTNEGQGNSGFFSRFKKS